MSRQVHPFQASAQTILLISSFKFKIYTNLTQSMQSQKDLRSKFWQAIDGDNPITKLWKYRSFIQYYPKEAQTLKDRMLDLAIKNKLPGEYEAIYRLFGVNINQIPRDNTYGQLKEQTLPVINNIKVEASNYEQVGKVEEEVKAYLKLGEQLAQLGDHKESDHYYCKIMRRASNQNVIKEEDLLPAWGKQIFYLIDDPLNNFSSEFEVFAMRDLADKKKMNSTLALIKDIYNLTKKGRGLGRVKVFEHLKADHLTTTNVMNNGIMSLLDLGFLYSIVALAFLSREALKQDIKWSSKLEISYLQTDYKKLMHDIHRSYDNFGKFNPTIRFVFEQCLKEISQRILLEVFDAYQMISLAKIQQLTAFDQTHVTRFLDEHPEIPYLFDPITKSIVFYQKSQPLYEEALNFFKVIKDSYEEKEKVFLGDAKEDFDEDEIKPRIGSIFGGGGFRMRDRMF